MKLRSGPRYSSRGRMHRSEGTTHPPSALIVDADPFARRGTGASRIFILLSHGGALLAWLSAKRLVPSQLGFYSSDRHSQSPSDFAERKVIRIPQLKCSS